MRKIFQLSVAALALWAYAARAAWNYQDGDVLLIFRESGFNDVEFDIGRVNQCVKQCTGYTTAVTAWNLPLVTNTFGADLTGVRVLVAATTSWTNVNKTSWLSVSLPNTTAYNVTPSVWQQDLWSVIDSIGTRPITYAVPISSASAYSIDPGGSFRVASYDQIVDGNGVNAASLAELGGNAPFIVEQTIPGTFLLWGIQPSAANPKPADALVGSFTITADGTLTFAAGPPPSDDRWPYAVRRRCQRRFVLDDSRRPVLAGLHEPVGRASVRLADCRRTGGRHREQQHAVRHELDRHGGFLRGDPIPVGA